MIKLKLQRGNTSLFWVSLAKDSLHFGPLNQIFAGHVVISSITIIITIIIIITSSVLFLIINFIANNSMY